MVKQCKRLIVAICLLVHALDARALDGLVIPALDWISRALSAIKNIFYLFKSSIWSYLLFNIKSYSYPFSKKMLANFQAGKGIIYVTRRINRKPATFK